MDSSEQTKASMGVRQWLELLFAVAVCGSSFYWFPGSPGNDAMTLAVDRWVNALTARIVNMLVGREVSDFSNYVLLGRYFWFVFVMFAYVSITSPWACLAARIAGLCRSLLALPALLFVRSIVLAFILVCRLLPDATALAVDNYLSIFLVVIMGGLGSLPVDEAAVARIRKRHFPRFDDAAFAAVDRWLSRAVLVLLAVVSLVGSALALRERLAPTAAPAVQTQTIDTYRPVVYLPRAAAILTIANPDKPGEGQMVGSGVCLRRNVDGVRRTMLLTARHVANCIHAIHGMIELKLMTPDGGTRHVLVRRKRWLVDDLVDDDLAVMDLTGIAEDAVAIDIDAMDGIATTKQLTELGVEFGCKAVALCGNPQTCSFEAKGGWYLGRDESTGLFFYDIYAEQGNSGSPVFVSAGGRWMLAGICSRCIKVEEKQCLAAVPLDNLVTLTDGDAHGFFGGGNSKSSKGPDFPRGAELLKLKGLPMGSLRPGSSNFILPVSLTVKDREYAVKRKDSQSFIFSIEDEAGNVVQQGRYSIWASENEARLAALGYCAAGRRVPNERLARRISYEWINEKEGVLHLIGVTGVHHILFDNIVISLARRNGAEDFLLPLAEAMARRKLGPELGK